MNTLSMSLLLLVLTSLLILPLSGRLVQIQLTDKTSPTAFFANCTYSTQPNLEGIYSNAIKGTEFHCAYERPMGDTYFTAVDDTLNFTGYFNPGSGTGPFNLTCNNGGYLRSIWLTNLEIAIQAGCCDNILANLILMAQHELPMASMVTTDHEFEEETVPVPATSLFK